MKFYESRDFEDNIIEKSQDRRRVIEAFLERYPSFDKKYIDPFLYEIEVTFDVCLPEYEGVLSKKKWKQGKVQQKVCQVVNFTRVRLGKEKTSTQVSKLWRFDNLEVKKNYKIW